MKTLLLFIPILIACTKTVQYEDPRYNNVLKMFKEYHVVDSMLAEKMKYCELKSRISDSILLVKVMSWDNWQYNYFDNKSDSMQKTYFSAIEYVFNRYDSLEKKLDTHGHDIFGIDTVIFVRFEVRDNMIINGHKYDSLLYELILDPKFKDMFGKEILNQ